MLIVTQEKAHADCLINILKSHFRIKDLGEPTYTVGIHIKYDRKNRKMKLNQLLYIETITKRRHKLSLNTTSPADKGL